MGTYFSYTIQIGSNWYMDTGVRDLEVACFKANSTWINDIGSKDLFKQTKIFWGYGHFKLISK